MSETNLPTAVDPKLKVAADRLLEAAMAYWVEYKRVTGGSAVVWLTDSDGRMVVLTRGEYRRELMRNIETLRQDPVRSFE